GDLGTSVGLLERVGRLGGVLDRLAVAVPLVGELGGRRTPAGLSRQRRAAPRDAPERRLGRLLEELLERDRRRGLRDGLVAGLGRRHLDGDLLLRVLRRDLVGGLGGAGDRLAIAVPLVGELGGLGSPRAHSGLERGAKVL